MNLLTNYTHDLELQAITVPLLIYASYSSLHTKSSPDFLVFHILFLVMDLNSSDSSASVLMPLPAG
jgi:hypothetical protein